MQQQAREVCSGAAFDEYFDVPFDESSLDANYLWPAEDNWRDGDHEVVCVAFNGNGRPLTRSMAGAGSDRALQRDRAQHLVQLVEGPPGAAPRRPELGEDALDPHPLGHQLTARSRAPARSRPAAAIPTSPATGASPRARAAGGSSARPSIQYTRAANACSSRLVGDPVVRRARGCPDAGSTRVRHHRRHDRVLGPPAAASYAVIRSAGATDGRPAERPGGVAGAECDRHPFQDVGAHRGRRRARIAIGSLGPWAKVDTVFGTISVNGTSGDGPLTIVAAGLVLAGFLSSVWVLRWVGAIGALAVGGYDLINASSRFSDLNAGNEFAHASVAWGLWLVVAAAVVAIVAAARTPKRSRAL